MTVDTKTLHQLNESLHYLKVDELKNICAQYNLESKGNKITMIHCIMVFVETGTINKKLPMPAVSKAKKGGVYPIEPDALMLYGAYKNDLKTRIFFKKLIGNHFHFTAYGIDWLNERWNQGIPPTYAEFAVFWQQEHTLRQTVKVAPKKEWAYINYTQRVLAEHPHATRDEITQAWEQERHRHLALVKKILDL